MTAIIGRRSIRRYESEPVAESIIDDLLTAAAWAPSAHNRQPWRFAVVTESAEKDRLAVSMGRKLRADLEADQLSAQAIEKDVQRSYQRITGAPALVLVCMSMADMDHYPDPERQNHERVMAIQSTAMAGQNLLLAAHAAGLGACWMCAPLFSPEAVRQVLDLPADWEPQGLITLGYPAEVKQKARHPLNSKIKHPNVDNSY